MKISGNIAFIENPIARIVIEIRLKTYLFPSFFPLKASAAIMIIRGFA